MSPGQIRTFIVDMLADLTVTVDGEAFSVPTYTEPQDKPTPPLAFVLGNEPYIEPAGSFGQHAVHNQITLVTPTGANELMAGWLDEMVTTVLSKIDAFSPIVNLDNVARPGSIAISGQTYYGCEVFVSTYTNLSADD